MPTIGTVLALLYILYIRYHVLDVLDVTTTYVVLTIVKSTTPLFIALTGQNRGDARGGMERETGKRRPVSYCKRSGNGALTLQALRAL